MNKEKKVPTMTKRWIGQTKTSQHVQPAPKRTLWGKRKAEITDKALGGASRKLLQRPAIQVGAPAIPGLSRHNLSKSLYWGTRCNHSDRGSLYCPRSSQEAQKICFCP